MSMAVHPQLEKVARAMVLNDGLDPDEEIIGGQASGFQNYGPLWQAEQFSEGQLGVTDYLGLARAAVHALMDNTHGLSQWEYERDALDITLRPLVEGGVPAISQAPHQPTPGVYGPGQGEG